MVVSGFVLLLFGSVIDITDNFDSLNRFVIIGDTKTEAFLEKFVGFLGGFILLTIGLVRWVPSVHQLEAEITERKRGEEALREAHENLEQRVEERTKLLKESENRYRTLATVSPVGIFRADVDGKVNYVNEKWCEIGDMTADEAMGDGWYTAIHPDERDQIAGRWDEYLEEGSVYQYEQLYQRKNGRTTNCLVQVAAEIDGDGRIVGYVGTVTDITERYELDRMKSEFASTVSHELRTPLTAIKGSLGLVVSGTLGELPEKAKDMVNVGRRNTDRLINLVNDILDIEKLESGGMEFEIQSLDLHGLVKETIVTNKEFAKEHGVKFVLADVASKVMVQGDSSRLVQVIVNLLSNAAKFSPDDSEVAVSVTRHDGVARVSISDYGPGISEEFHEHIFERFYQVDAADDRQKGGTGLGLSISKSIVEKHGGTIDFESKPGEGSTFFFMLPVSK